jgi:NAD(P)-dependent dehydrogenase (short-subunit alcohol dehydrogenase family)
MAWSLRDIPDLSGKVFVVTGSNSGIGLEAAEALAGRGAKVVMACRSTAKAKDGCDRIRAKHAGADIDVRALDLSSLASVRSFAEGLAKDHPTIDTLINNAGIMAVPRALTADGFEMQLGTNHLGHFALTGLLLPALAKAKSARVVTVSSSVHRGGTIAWDDLMGERRYDKWGAYMQSKLANLLFTLELERRLQKVHPTIRSLSCHPGYAATNLQTVGPKLEQSWTARIFETGNAIVAQSAAAGALPTLRAATDPGARGGEFYGPRGPFALWGAPVVEKPAARTRDEAEARRLWERSMELTGVRYLEG